MHGITFAVGIELKLSAGNSVKTVLFAYGAPTKANPRVRFGLLHLPFVIMKLTPRGMAEFPGNFFDCGKPGIAYFRIKFV